MRPLVLFADLFRLFGGLRPTLLGLEEESGKLLMLNKCLRPATLVVWGGTFLQHQGSR